MKHAVPKILVLLLATLLLSHCAQTSPPLPPALELPKPVTDLRATRKGDRVYLRWTVPARTMDGESVRSLGATHVCRGIDAAIKVCESPVGDVPPGPIVETSKKKDKTAVVAEAVEGTYTDTLPADLQQQNATKILTYVISVSNHDGRAAGISNRVQVPATPTLAPPADFKAQVTADGVLLSWSSLASPEDSTPSHIYRVYRKQDDKVGETLVGELPLGDAANQLVDHGFEWQKNYSYRATVATEVSLGMHPCAGAASTPAMDCAAVVFVEGEDTPAVQVSTNDAFPPAVPSGLQAVFSGPGQQAFVDLIWSPDVEADLAGYIVYRREENGQPTRMNSELVKTPAYRDAKVEPGKKYFYSVTAMDARNNESEHSEEASELVP
jgi:fibronectin type 3 domain-containing protein